MIECVCVHTIKYYLAKSLITFRGSSLNDVESTYSFSYYRDTRYRVKSAFFFSLSGILGECPIIQPPQGGLMRERIQDNTLQIIFSCEPNRLRLKGHKVMTCTTDGWDHPVPKCVPRGKIPYLLF